MIKVVIDPGHGGPSNPPKVGGSSWNNATGPGGTLEKTVTLKVGKAVKAAFAGSGISVVMTRETDVNLGIAARAKKAKDIAAEAFVSIHFNAAPSNGPPAQGTETWIGTAPTARSRKLAKHVQAAVLAVTGLHNRGVKEGNVSGVIKNSNHHPLTAHCLVEVSFLDRQPAEEARLSGQAYIDALGQAIHDGIMQYLADQQLAGGVETDISDEVSIAPDEPEDAASAMAGETYRAYPPAHDAIDSSDNGVAAFARVPFIGDRWDDEPFADLGGKGRVDNPAKMLRGWTEGAMFEVSVAEWNTVQAALLQILGEKRRAVARIEVPGAPGRVNFLGEPAPNGWHGSAFMVGENLLLTNHHVLNSIEVARDAIAEFDYELAAPDLVAARTAAPSAPKRIKLNPDRLFITSPATDGGLDYTFVWIEDAAKEFGVIPMRRASFTVSKFDPVFIIHHPRGRLKEASLDDTETLRIKSTVIHYAADTDYGSSGSPVFDRSGRLIALHHARNGDGPEKLQDGRTVDMLNEGIKISAIALDLENRIARGEDTKAAGEVLAHMAGSDTLSGFFGALGRAAPIGESDVEAVVDTYQGTERDLDIGFWNIEWLANRWRDSARLEGAATVITDLNLDIWSLIEVSPAAVRALVAKLKDKFGETYQYALSEPESAESKQSTAVIWKPRLISGGKVEWPEPIRGWWDLDSRDDLPFEAVDGKIFNRYPARYRFSLKGRENLPPFVFNLVPLHLKAMAEGSKRRRLASLLLARAIERMSGDGAEGDWIIGGDINDNLASGDFDELIDAGLQPMSAADEAAGAFTYLKSPKSLIDSVFLSPNVKRTVGGADYFIVAKEKSIDKYIKQISDHRPVVARFTVGGDSEADVRAIVERITSRSYGAAERGLRRRAPAPATPR